ncbi:MAG: hypothetical protein IAE91_14240 [Ignavibacteriaceae bacterium]|nr:hypothetical protein [Ignavibacteriaceae bacterium]
MNPKEYTILIADDDFKEINEYKEKLLDCKIKFNIELNIFTASKVNEVLDLIESQNADTRFDLILMDLNFSVGDIKHGGRFSGFKLIETAHEVNPISLIMVVSNNIVKSDFSNALSNLIRSGKISIQIDKAEEIKDPGLFEKNFEVALKLIEKRKVLKDIFTNHTLILESITDEEFKEQLKLDQNVVIDIIKSELDSEILTHYSKEITKINTLNPTTPENFHTKKKQGVNYRIVLILYQLILEKYAELNYTEVEILNRLKEYSGNINEITGRTKIGKDVVDLAFKKEKNGKLKRKKFFSSLVKLLIIHIDERIKFAEILSKSRNSAAHNLEKNLDFNHCIFAHLVVSLYIIDDKTKIQITNIKSARLQELPGYEELVEIINFIEAKNY